MSEREMTPGHITTERQKITLEPRSDWLQSCSGIRSKSCDPNMWNGWREGDWLFQCKDRVRTPVMRNISCFDFISHFLVCHPLYYYYRSFEACRRDAVLIPVISALPHLLGRVSVSNIPYCLPKSLMFISVLHFWFWECCHHRYTWKSHTRCHIKFWTSAIFMDKKGKQGIERSLGHGGKSLDSVPGFVDSWGCDLVFVPQYPLPAKWAL